LRGKMMTEFRVRRIVACAMLFVGTLCFATKGLAQQITYFDFDTPQANGQFSYACADPAKGAPAVPNPLFCFNDVSLAAANPSFFSDTFPAIIDPVVTDNPPVASTHFAIQTTPAALQQGSSLWFSVPQKVSDGFSAWFAFKLTPTAASSFTADGIAFVVQNSIGGAVGTTDGTLCTAIGSGPNVVGGRGGCIGYGGIDNSLAIEFDTFRNSWDQFDLVASTRSDNHVAVQNCGAGKPNSPSHNTCEVSLLNGNVSTPAYNGSLPVTLADGNVHQVVVTYSGPTEAVPNLLQIFIDPTFVAGTHTPVAGSVPILSGAYNLATGLNLMSSGTANDSAFVGFTSATGADFEQQELMAWTFTPHTPVTQQQPLNPPGTPTTFPFGAHVYAVTYPLSGPGTSGIDMVVTANTVTPSFFTQLIGATAFAGSQCQIYDETGGNCIIYSVSCVTHGTSNVVPCPSTADPSNLISVKSAYNNTLQPVSPGYLQGDPLFSGIDTISGDGRTATVTCTGECSVTTGQTVTIAGSTASGNVPSGFNGTITVGTADPNVPNSFTFSSTVSTPATGGYLTSNNVQNIFVSFNPQRIDGTSIGKTKNFSDLVVTSLTIAPTTLVIQAPSVAFGTPAQVTVTATSPLGTPTGSVVLTVDSGAPQTMTLTNGTANFALSGLSAGPHALSVTYAAQGVFQAVTQTGSLTITGGPKVSLSPSPLRFGNVNQGSLETRFVTLTNIGTAPLAVTDQDFWIANGGNSSNFIILTLCPAKLAPGRSCSIAVFFYAYPPAAEQTAILKVYDSAPGSPQLVPLSATVINPRATLKPSYVRFGTQDLGTSGHASVTLANTGTTPLVITSVGVAGANASDFSENDNCHSSTLAPNATCNIAVTFTPKVAGTRNAHIDILDNERFGIVQVPLNGTGH
jgi:Bacterial lectin/Abnormal spindle-like microcephaly-assoc'd, ASPM-SPD-2-Hydin